MTELTKEYLDKNLKNLVTKEDLKVLPTKQEVKDIVNEAVEDLSKIINDGFQAQQEFLIEKLMLLKE